MRRLAEQLPPAPPFASSLLLANEKRLPSRASALVALPDGQVLAGTCDGHLFLLERESVIAWADAPLASNRCGAIAQLACDAAFSFVFALHCGAVLHAALPSEPDGGMGGGSQSMTTTGWKLQLLPVPSEVLCVAASATSAAGARLCCATRSTMLHVFRFSHPDVGIDGGGGGGGGGGGDGGGGGGDGGSEAVDLPSGTGPASDLGLGPGSGHASRPSSADREKRDDEARLVRLGPQRRKPILPDLKGLKGEKAMPPWMVFKVAATMLFNKIDLDDNPDDEPEDLGECRE